MQKKIYFWRTLWNYSGDRDATQKSCATGITHYMDFIILMNRYRRSHYTNVPDSRSCIIFRKMQKPNTEATAVSLCIHLGKNCFIHNLEIFYLWTCIYIIIYSVHHLQELKRISWIKNWRSINLSCNCVPNTCIQSGRLSGWQWSKSE